MKRSYVKFALTCGTMLAGISAASPVLAQAAAADNGGFEEIIVTARKSQERARDVPVSITAVSGASLAEAKITQIGDLTARIPTLSISYGATQPLVLIRGFGTGNGQSFDQAVGKFIDNVSYGRDQDARLPLFDIERLEVLKGPQVLLYGNSSTAGALNITTRKPGSEFAADGSIAYEFNQNETVAQGGMTIPLAETVAVRLSGLYQRLAKGPNFNVATGKHVSTDRNYAGRAILRFTPNADFEVLLKAEYDHIRNKGLVGEPIAQPLGGYQFPEVNFDGRVNANNNVAPMFQRDYQSLDNETYQMDINYDVLGGRLTSTTGYRRLETGLASSGGQDVPLFSGYIAYLNKQFSQELRYAGKFGALDLTVGGFYQHEKRDNFTVADFNAAAIGIPVPAFSLNLVSPQKAESWSLFGDVTYHLSEQLSIAVGARYSDISRDADQSANPGLVVPNRSFGQGAGWLAPAPFLDGLYTGFFGVPPHSFTGLHLHETHFQPQVIVQYKITDRAQVYAKYVKGDKSGGFDVAYQGTPGNVTPAGAQFEPEKAEGFEVGLKGVSDDNRFDYALAAYRTTFTNLQTNAYVGTATVAVVTNVGKARTQGVEAEFHYTPMRGLRFGASLAYTDAKYLDFPGGACTRAQEAVTPVGCRQDLSGSRTPFSSKWAGTISVDYEQPIGSYVLNGGVLAAGQSSYNPTSNLEPLEQQDAYVQIDANIGLKPDAGPWSLSLFVRNLTNIRYNEYGSISPGTTQGLLGYLSRGRQLGIRAGFDF